MKHKLSEAQSSYLVSWPVIGLFFVLGILAAFKGWFIPCGVLLVIAIASLFCRIWAMFSCNDLKIKIRHSCAGVFPQDEIRTTLRITNDKFLPVIWMKLNCPMEKDAPFEIEGAKYRELREADKNGDGEIIISKVAEVKLPSFLWYETNEQTITWKAIHRGVYRLNELSVVSGDGLGLSQLDRKIHENSCNYFAVYPAVTDVSDKLFLRNLWNGETGAKGICEDLTVIRSSREYMPSDSARRINWRLAARNLPVQVNVFEEILPRSVHIIIDGESFSSPDPHLEELEDMLSVIGSELILLHEQNVGCGLTVCSGSNGECTHLFADNSDLEDMLFALAAYKPFKKKVGENNTKILMQEPDFNIESLAAKLPSIGRTFFVTYSKESASGRKIVECLNNTQTTIITYTDNGNVGEFETVCLSSLKGGNDND